jgi:hypothetical protein
MNDWSSDAADAIENAVALVRDRSVKPAQAIRKGVVFGLLAALVAIPAVLLTLIVVFRGTVAVYQGEVWAAWLTYGAIFLAFGGFLFAKRNPRNP